ncbi:MAG: 1-acyl-sn-glycerol-3-phosphate acyltransferase [Ferruginibacter sp.]
MLYQLLKIPAWLGFRLYCRHLKTNNAAAFSLEGPLLIAANHPDSFLDAIILATLFKKPVYSLARGDVFKKPLFAKLLYSLKIYPVYRTSEGVENMEHNYSTFNACREIFRKKGIVLIFSEGRCINEWHLRPLKKGTARLAISSWEEGIDLKILPAGLNYQSFHSYDKNMHVLFGNVFGSEVMDRNNSFGKNVQAFNVRLQQELEPVVYEIANEDIAMRKKVFEVKVPAWKKIALLIPALIAVLAHFPLYMLAKSMAQKYGSANDHYDSIIVAVLFVFYPLYLLLLTVLVFLISGMHWSWLLLAVLPFCAWSYLQIKKQVF